MRVAALYDIHGNLPALEAVLAELRVAGVDRVVVGGDVLPGPMPAACLDALSALDVPVAYLFGNGERDVLAVRGGSMPARVPPAFHETMRWVMAALPADSLDFLATWPRTVRVTSSTLGEVLFCHATPADENRIFTRSTDEQRLRPEFEGADAELVVCGHTHMQFERTISIDDGRAVRIVNAGSVGMPFGEPGAYWALLGKDVELRRTVYDVEAAQQAISATEYPADLDLLHPPSETDMLNVFEAASSRQS